jgi:hypothetical protein
MSRLTGNDAKSLMEAYAAVYTPQEISEEQVWEQVEEWVNSLVEEGYDLSEYTWEEMYEDYLSEMGGQNRPGQQSTTTGAVTMYAQPRANTGQSYQSPYARPRQDKLNSLNTGGRRPQISNIDPREGTGRGGPSDINRRQAPPPPPNDKPRTGQPQPPAANSARPPAAPAANSARPPAAPAAKPTPARASSPANASTSEKIAGGLKVYDAQRKAGDMAGASKTGMDVWRAANSKLAAADDERARIRGTSATTNPLMKDFKSRLPAPAAPAATPAPTKPAPAATATSTPAPTTPKPTPTGPRTRSQVLNQSFDVFDVVIGHLLDEGYADTEEAALAIMTNMSEEWRESIFEKYVPWDMSRGNRPSPRDRAATRRVQHSSSGTPQGKEREAQVSRVQTNMRTGINKSAERSGIDPRREGTAPATPRHIRSAQTTGGTAGGRMYAAPQGGPKPSGVPSGRIPATPELRKANTSAQLRQALRSGKGGGGSSSLPSLGSPSGSGKFTVGGERGYGLSGIKLAN